MMAKSSSMFLSKMITAIFRLFGIILVLFVHHRWRFSQHCSTAKNDDPPIAVHDDASILLDPCRVYSDSYEMAKTRFLELVTRQVSDAKWHSLEIVNSTLTTDIAVIPGNKNNVIVHVSGTHGVEGYAGSAIQLAFLQSLALEDKQQEGETDDDADNRPTIILIHALNPYGMLKFRRPNEHNVDLNRNGLSHTEWTTFANNHWNMKMYNKFSHVFEQDGIYFTNSRFGSYLSTMLLSWYKTITAVLQFGIPQLKQAMVGGQYHSPHGIFYGGNHTEPSLWKVRDFLIATYPHLFEIENNITWIDVHTGLGPLGQDAILPSTLMNEQNLSIQQQESIFPGSHYQKASVAQGYEDVRGLTVDYFYHELVASSSTSDADEQDSSNNKKKNTGQHLFFVQEFGTLPTTLVGNALIVENAAHNHYYNNNNNSSATNAASEDEALWWAQRTTRAVFYPSNAVWRQRVLQRGLDVLLRAVTRMTSASTSTRKQQQQQDTGVPAQRKDADRETTDEL